MDSKIKQKTCLLKCFRGNQKKYKPFFQLEGFKVTTEKRFDNRIFAEASVRLSVDGNNEFCAAEGDGPVNALDLALRAALISKYPELAQLRLEDYKVRIIPEQRGTAAKVRVLIESSIAEKRFGTVGVDENIVAASWKALADGFSYAHLLIRANQVKKRKRG